MRIATPSASPTSGGNGIAFFGQIFEHKTFVNVPNQSPRRYLDHYVLSVTAVPIASLTVRATWSFPMLAVHQW
jgi:hypothetical protein